MSSAKNAVVDVEGKPINKRFQNMFEEEIVVTDKFKMRKELTDNKEKMKDLIKAMSPMDIFVLFDDDDSGLISFQEFRRMLPFLSINISDAKAFRYFRMCDTDGSGEIDVDEFQVALFACDPVRPSALRCACLLTLCALSDCRRAAMRWAFARPTTSRPWTPSSSSTR